MEANVIVDGVAYNYHVTEDGRVFSLNYRHTGEIRELKYNKKNGYRCVFLCKDGKEKNAKVARLVAIAYIPNPTNKPTVDHISRNKIDDRVENLRWATYSEQIINQKHQKNNKKSKAVMCVETRKTYQSTMEVERQLGFTHSYISRCCKGKCKTAYGYHWQYVKEVDVSE